MEQVLKELHTTYYNELMACPSNEIDRLYYICGKQRALEELAHKSGFNLKGNNIFAFAEIFEERNKPIPTKLVYRNMPLGELAEMANVLDKDNSPITVLEVPEDYHMRWHDLVRWLDFGIAYMEKRAEDLEKQPRSQKEEARVKAKLDGLTTIKEYIDETERIF